MNDSSPEFETNLRQEVTGDHNQVIGQANDSIIIYSNTGQVVINGPGVASKTEIAPGENPYKGLQFFNEEDRDRFFGRDATIDALRSRLQGLYVHQKVRFLPVYGPSGSGKSSVVRAGLLPKLAQQPLQGYGPARVLVMVPGTRPIYTLALRLAQVLQDAGVGTDAEQLEERLLQQNLETKEFEGLAREVMALPGIEGAPLLVIVDQFEEIYAYTKEISTAERDCFVSNLLCAATDASGNVLVVVTFRSDFLGETQQHPHLNNLFTSQGYLVPAMDEAGLREAIAKPAEQAGRALDGYTIDRLVAETTGREGALPLLQYALQDIWQKRVSGAGTEILRRVTVGGALAQRAQELYEHLEVVDRELARRIFLSAVQLGEGQAVMRRRVLLTEIAMGEELTALKQVADWFARKEVRLLVLSGEATVTVEVTHEALFRHWGLFKAWLNESRDDLRLQQRLKEAVKNWNEQGRPEGSLWRSPDLDRLCQFQKDVDMKRTVLQMTSLEKKFTQASQGAERKRRYLRWLVIGSLLGLSVLALLGLFFARRASNLATAQRLAAQAINKKNERLDLALLLSLQSLNIVDSSEGRSALAEVLQYSPFLQIFLHHEESSADPCIQPRWRYSCVWKPRRSDRSMGSGNQN